jgi:hypothetical protein
MILSFYKPGLFQVLLGGTHTRLLRLLQKAIGVFKRPCLSYTRTRHLHKHLDYNFWDYISRSMGVCKYNTIWVFCDLHFWGGFCKVVDDHGDGPAYPLRYFSNLWMLTHNSNHT